MPFAQSVVPSSGSTATSTSGGSPVAEALAVEEHRRFVLLAFADDDEPVHLDPAEHRAHRVDRGAVGGLLVATSHPARGCERRRLGDTDEFHGEVAVGKVAHAADSTAAETPWAADRRWRPWGSLDRSNAIRVVPKFLHDRPR